MDEDGGSDALFVVDGDPGDSDFGPTLGKLSDNYLTEFPGPLAVGGT